MYFIVSWYLSAVQNGFLVTPFLLQSLLKVPKVSSLSLNSLPYICPFSLGQSLLHILKLDPRMQRGGRSSASVLDRVVGSCCLGNILLLILSGTLSSGNTPAGRTRTDGKLFSPSLSLSETRGETLVLVTRETES